MYYARSRAARSCVKLCGLALRIPRPSPSSANVERAQVDLAYKSILSVGFCTSALVTFHGSRSTGLELSCENPVGSDGGSAQETAKFIWAEKRPRLNRKRRQIEWLNERIPGYVYDSQDNGVRHLLIAMNKLQVESLWSVMDPNLLKVTLFNLVVSDASNPEKVIHRLPVLPRRINYDKSGHICNVGFVKALPSVKIKLDARIHFVKIEDCIGVKKGGRLEVYLKYVALFCSPEELFPCIIIDVAMMDIGDRICLGDLDLEVSLHSSNESSIVICEVV